MTPVRTAHLTAALPQLDVHTISEDWALSRGMEEVWHLLASSLGKPPSEWQDAQGDRMYAAAIALSTRFDLTDTVGEDDQISIETRILAIRKPHALAEVRFMVDGKAKAEVRLLTSFIKRSNKGSNKKFSKVRDVWQAEDINAEVIDALLEDHHAAKSEPGVGQITLNYEVNRIQDFNMADMLYFKNFVRIAKAAEWRANRGQPTRLNSHRTCYFFGNADDGDTIHAFVDRTKDTTRTELRDTEGRCLFRSLATTPIVEIAVR